MGLIGCRVVQQSRIVSQPGARLTIFASASLGFHGLHTRHERLYPNSFDVHDQLVEILQNCL
jgi:hypothetical protein